MVIFITFRAFDITQIVGVTPHLHYDIPLYGETLRIMLFEALLLISQLYGQSSSPLSYSIIKVSLLIFSSFLDPSLLIIVKRHFLFLKGAV